MRTGKGTVDLLELADLYETDLPHGTKKVKGFCASRALVDGGDIEDGEADLAFRIDSDAHLNVHLQDAFPGMSLTGSRLIRRTIIHV